MCIISQKIPPYLFMELRNEFLGAAAGGFIGYKLISPFLFGGLSNVKL